MLDNLKIYIDKPTIILVDNKPAVILADDGDHLKRSKHFLVKTMYIREQKNLGNIFLQHIEGSLNHADIHTKALKGMLLQRHTAGVLGLEEFDLINLRHDEENFDMDD